PRHREDQVLGNHLQSSLEEDLQLRSAERSLRESPYPPLIDRASRKWFLQRDLNPLMESPGGVLVPWHLKRISLWLDGKSGSVLEIASRQDRFPVLSGALEQSTL